MAAVPEVIKHSRQELDEAKTLPEVKQLRDKIAAIRDYARASGESRERLNEFGEAKVRAECKGGRILHEIERQRGFAHSPHGGTNETPYQQVLADAELSSSAADRWQIMALVPEKVLKAYFATQNKRKDALITSRDVYKMGRKIQRDRAGSDVDETILLPENLELKVGDFRKLCGKMEAESVDLIFTDPPYDEESLPLWRDLGCHAARLLKPGGILLSYSGQRFLDRVFTSIPDDLNYYWMLGVQHTHGQLRFWDRKCWNSWKPIIAWSKGKPKNEWFNDFLSIGNPETKDRHEWSQPIDQAKYLTKRFCPENGTVLDPMCGAGTIPIGSWSIGRKAIGIDIEAKHIASAEARWSEEHDRASA